MVNPIYADGITTLIEVAGTLHRSAQLAEELAALHPDRPWLAEHAAERRREANSHLAAAEALENLG